jgi:hypothetical protein
VFVSVAYTCNYYGCLVCEGSGWLSQYSDLLWAGLSGDQIPVRVRFPTPVQTGPGAHPASHSGYRRIPGG